MLHWAWIVLAVGFLNLVISYGIRLGYGVVLPEMIRTLGLNRKQGGDIFNAYLIAYILVSPLTGILTDRIGPRSVISLYGIMLGGGTLLMGRSENLLGASLFFAVTGVGGSAMWTPVVTVVQRWFTTRKRGMALGILSTGFGLGYAVMGRLHPLIMKRFSWRHSWYFLGVAALAMIAVNALLLRNRPEDKGLLPWGEGSPDSQSVPPAGVQKNESGKTVSEAPFYSQKRFWIVGFSYFFGALALYLVTTYLVDYAKNTLLFPLEKASALASIHGLGQVAGVMTIPMLSDRVGRRKSLALTNCVIAVSSSGILLSAGREAPLFFSVAVFGMAYGATWPLYSACAGDLFNKESVGSVVGAWTPFYGVGAIVAHRLAGHFRDTTGSFTLPFLYAVIGAFVAAVLIMLVRRRFPGS